MYYIGYDLGSSSIKAALVDSETGNRVGLVTEPDSEMGMIASKPGWAEQHPEDWWTHICKATQRLLAEHKVNAEDIGGIGIAYQMHGLVVLDDQGDVLRPSIIWCDSRAVEIGDRAYQSLGQGRCSQELLNTPGNFTASKLRWIREEEPQIFKKIHKFMLPGDYISYRLSGKMNTTISGLSEGILWDFKAAQPAFWLMEHYGIAASLLPELVPTFGLQGKVSARGAAESGLKEGTPILYRAGDQPNNALSLNVFRPGEVAATGGTSGVFYAITDKLELSETERVNNFAHVNYSPDSPNIGKLLCINGAGIQYRWLLNNLSVASYAEMNELAQSVSVGSVGLVILPFGNGAERMLHNQSTGTRILNLNLNTHDKAHLCRAALEGIAFSFVYGMELLGSDGQKPGVIRAGNDNLFQSDIFSTTISTLIGQDIEIYNTTGAIGAARACLLTSGDYELFGKQIMENDFVKSFSPAAVAKPYREAYTLWKNELNNNLKNI